MINILIEKILNKENLTVEESEEIMLKLMSGELTNAQIAGLLIALKSKGEAASEVAGFVKAMREKSIKINLSNIAPIDVCGTGGDKSNTFNISTAASFVLAAGNVPVAKHGNRAISSKSGSADVLKELGINIELSHEHSKKAIEEIGISFLFAPLYHPAMKYAAPVRKELGVKTIFNILGPLTNPAGTKKQVIGTYSNQNAELMINAAAQLDYEQIALICTEDKYDEITLTGETKVYEYTADKGIKEYFILPMDFGTEIIDIMELEGDDAKFNAEIIQNIFSGKTDSPAVNVVCANAAFSFYINGYSENLKECFNYAKKLISEGKVLSKLEELKSFGMNS